MDQSIDPNLVRLNGPIKQNAQPSACWRYVPQKGEKFFKGPIPLWWLESFVCSLRHVGASPIDVTTSKRLHLAYLLLTHSTLPITEVAFASGYQSLRRFNEAFKEKFHVVPTVVRRSTDQILDKNSNFIRIELPVVDPDH